MGPDFIIWDWFDRPVGRRSDKHFMAASGVNRILVDAQSLPPGRRQYWVYLDKGYDMDSHCRCAAHGARHLMTAQQIHFNYVMSLVRICVEWGFAKLQERNPLLTRHYMLKIQMHDVAKVVRVGVLLTNAHTCMQGAVGNIYFHVRPPSLHEYFL
jgi:hypothetical protein